MLDYRKEWKKLQLVGENEATVFSEIMLLLARLLNLGAARVAESSVVLRLALRISSLPVVYFDFLGVLTKSLPKLQRTADTVALVAASIEVLVSHIPTDTQADEEVNIIEGLLTLFQCCPETFLDILEERLK